MAADKPPWTQDDINTIAEKLQDATAGWEDHQRELLSAVFALANEALNESPVRTAFVQAFEPGLSTDLYRRPGRRPTLNWDLCMGIYSPPPPPPRPNPPRWPPY